MRGRVREFGVAALVLGLFCSAPPVLGQGGPPSVDVSVGGFFHIRDLHEYYPNRFDNAVVLGGGLSAPLSRMVSVRVVLEHVTTQLSGGHVFPQENRGRDRIMAAELQLIATPLPSGNLRPYLGGGGGFRRYTVNTAILSDDIIHWPWSEPQTQPAVSAIAGLATGVHRRFNVATEIKASGARFRVARDDWGLPADAVRWQVELRPAIRLQALLR